MLHTEKHLKSSEFITDIVIGMSDGLTVPFALAAGLSSAVSSNKIVITAGIAEIVAGCIAMGLGGYLAGKTEQEHYQSELEKEYSEVDSMPDREIQEVREVFAEYGISKEGQNVLALELAKDKTKWVSNEIPEPNEVAIWSAREGKVAGTHIVKYISDIDQIEISHVAHGREGFALGAVIAAEWIVGKKGVFGMKELLSIG